MRIKRRVSVVLALAFAARLPLVAQQGPDDDPDSAPGFVKSVFHRSSFDSINVYNGQLTIPIPIGPSYPIGPKLKFQTTLTYNSRVTELGHPYKGSPYISYTPLAGDPSLGAGWTLRLGKIGWCGSSGLATCFFRWDGAEINFMEPGQYKLAYQPNGAPEVWDGDGNHYVFNWHVTGFDDPPTNYIHDFGRGRDGWYLTSLSDPFGNSMTVEYYTNLATPKWTYSDGSCPDMQMLPPPAVPVPPGVLNTWIPKFIKLPTGTISVNLTAAAMIKSFTFPMHVGGVATTRDWTLTYKPDGESYGRPCGVSVKLEEIDGLHLPSDLPGAPAYGFAYQGFLTQMTLPAGGIVEYKYGDYNFYHGRVVQLNDTCSPVRPVDTAAVLFPALVPGSLSSRAVEPLAGRSRAPLKVPGNCDPLDDVRYLDSQPGVVARREKTSLSAPSADTEYYQYSFPFGMEGSTSSSKGAQTLTIVLLPPDVDGQRRATATLFYSGPGGVIWTQATGDRTGSAIREMAFERDPNYVTAADPHPLAIVQPACGGANDYPFCPNHAVRVTTRAFEWDNCSVEYGSCDANPRFNRRLKTETVYYGATASDATCGSCAYHTVDHRVTPGRTWQANGQHYNDEVHSGNLGGDDRTTTTKWTPASSPWLPNLFDRVTITQGTSTIDKYYEFDASNGFLKGTSLYDAIGQRTFLSCRFKDAAGNAKEEFSQTYANELAPRINACGGYAAVPALSGNGDMFGKRQTYQNGLRTSTRWINGTTSAVWPSFDVTRATSTGVITAIRDTAGLPTGYKYDSIGRVTEIAPPGEAVVTIGYPSATQTTATRNGGAGLSTYEEYAYDGLGRTVRERKLLPAATYAKRFHKYDAAGHEYFVSEWIDDAASETVAADLATTCSFSSGSASTSRPKGAPGTYRLCYDPFGRPQQVVGAMHSSLQTISRVDGAAFYSNTRETVTTACVNGSYSGSTCTGGTNSVTTSTTDAFGRVTKVTEPGGDVTTYGYDANGKLTSVVQGAQTRSYTYDAAGFLRSETTPEEGTVDYTDYGSLGNVLRTSLPGGVVQTRSYDFAGRLTALATNEGGARTYVQNTYQNATNSQGYSLGKLISRVGYNYSVAPTTTVTDALVYSGVGGRLSQQTTSIAGAASLSTIQAWKYNSLGLVAQHAHPRPAGKALFSVSTDYDAGLPSTEFVNGIPMVSGILYQPNASLSRFVGGIGIGHDLTTSVSQDGSLLPRPSRIFTTEQAAGTTLFDTQSYSYDGNGNVYRIGTDQYGYDARSRLVSASMAGLPAQTFSYDRWGNMTSRTTGGSAVTFGVNSLTNRLDNPGAPLGAVVATYDPRGNLLQNGGEGFAWDGLNRMTQATTTAVWKYLYDAAGERVAKVPPTGSWTFTLRDEKQRVVTELSGTTPSRDNVFLGNLLVASYANSAVGGNGPVWSLSSSDHLGTPRLLADLNGAVIEARKYQPFGEETTTQASYQALRFATMERDREGSRYYDHARSHDFGLARFLSPDVLPGRPSGPQSWNRFAYTRNNPLKLADTDGRAPLPQNAYEVAAAEGQEARQQISDAPIAKARFGIQFGGAERDGPVNTRAMVTRNLRTGEVTATVGDWTRGPVQGSVQGKANSDGATVDVGATVPVLPGLSFSASSNGDFTVNIGPACQVGDTVVVGAQLQFGVNAVKLWGGMLSAAKGTGAFLVGLFEQESNTRVGNPITPVIDEDPNKPRIPVPGLQVSQ